LNFSGYYILGLPLGILFTFNWHYGVLGIWLGLTIGIAFVSILGFYIIIFKTDWADQAKKALALASSHITTSLPITEE
jgi:MATE family multidrug resistance protein